MTILDLPFRASLALALLLAFALSGCAPEGDVGESQGELLRSLQPSLGSVGSFLPDRNDDIDACWEMEMECLEQCDDRPDTREDPAHRRPCEVRCAMIKQNCIDDVTGEGGPVDPFFSPA